MRIALASSAQHASWTKDSNDGAWQNFLEWLPSAAPAGHVAGIFEQHRAHLAVVGADDAEARRRIGDVRRHMRHRPVAWPLIFDKVFASDAPEFETLPNALLAATIAGLSPGAAVEIGVGQGRNAVFLARAGWAVTGLDVSEEGLAATSRNAAAAGVNVTTVHRADGDFDLGEAAWDLVVLTFVPVPVAAPEYAARLARALRPGGLIVVESFSSPESAPDRTPVDIDPDVLRKAYANWSVLFLHDDEVSKADWSARPARVVRMVAERPRSWASG